MEGGRRRLWRLSRWVMAAAFQKTQPRYESLRITGCRYQNRLFCRGYSSSHGIAPWQPELSHDLVNIMEQKLSAIESRHAHLQSVVNQPDASPGDYSNANKELKKLRHTMDVVAELRKINKEIEGLKLVISEAQDDKEMHEMASEELGQAFEEEKRLRYLLLKSLLPKDDADERDCILEVRAGTGGEEASLFAMDVFKMYEKYSQKKGWKFDILDVAESDLRGYKEASAAISGADVYGKLKFESGIHRVQRVPVTEKAGRVHTSAVSVVILPQADQFCCIKNRLFIFRPIKILFLCQNKAKALKIMCAKLYEMERTRAAASRSRLRAEQIGSGDRSERIRTYNFPQGRVTDHRVGITTHSIDGMMQGESLDTFIDALLLQQEMDAIASLTSKQ
ncbi:Peptide chain release factor 1 [Striga hermonthica]|uniref:Peptide chain release factor 1 n=1 Tax=Striga hermonthica TaxID=68872 RepID=A0A9N7R159_STRHE|nr:Peptide chain release factor 1 [Striga hermonthica]